MGKRCRRTKTTRPRGWAPPTSPGSAGTKRALRSCTKPSRRIFPKARTPRMPNNARNRRAAKPTRSRLRRAANSEPFATFNAARHRDASRFGRARSSRSVRVGCRSARDLFAPESRLNSKFVFHGAMATRRGLGVARREPAPARVRARRRRFVLRRGRSREPALGRFRSSAQIDARRYSSRDATGAGRKI
jgi:hypothetical protein